MNEQLKANRAAGGKKRSESQQKRNAIERARPTSDIRCIGVVLRIRGTTPIRKCTYNAIEGFPFCWRCNQQLVRQATIAALLRPGWSRIMRNITDKGIDYIEERQRAPLVTQTTDAEAQRLEDIAAERIRAELRWWEK